MLLEHAPRILGDVADLQRNLESLGDSVTGRVSVGAFPRPWPCWCPWRSRTWVVSIPGFGWR